MQEVPEHMHISSKLEEYLRKDKDAGEMHEGADGNGRGVLRNGAAGGSLQNQAEVVILAQKTGNWKRFHADLRKD